MKRIVWLPLFMFDLGIIYQGIKGREGIPQAACWPSHPVPYAARHSPSRHSISSPASPSFRAPSSRARRISSRARSTAVAHSLIPSAGRSDLLPERPSGRHRQCVTPQACLRHDAFEAHECETFVRLVSDRGPELIAAAVKGWIAGLTASSGQVSPWEIG